MKRAMPIVTAGTIIWFLALIVEIVSSAASETLWICVVGIIFGVMGLLTINRRLKREKI
jgi:Protein of unknown function (DUF2530)